MKILPPGNILQNLYLKERLSKQKWNNFLEIGSGNGYISNVLLRKGLSGVGCDLNKSACENNKSLNQKYVSKNKYKVYNQNFLDLDTSQKYDLIISSMVIEHLKEGELTKFIEKSKELLSENGNIVFYVPASMKHWGIEDEIAGHIKRYEFEDFKKMGDKYSLGIQHIAGLTYPLSNIFFNLSNKLIKKSESKVLKLSQREKTIYTGNRNVPYKTTFPPVFAIFLNDLVLYPFHLLQKSFKKNKNSLVIYCELFKK